MLTFFVRYFLYYFRFQNIDQAEDETIDFCEEDTLQEEDDVSIDELLALVLAEKKY